MNSQVSNMMSIDDHVDKINEAKNKIQNGIFEMAEAITEAVSQLGGRQYTFSELVKNFINVFLFTDKRWRQY